MNEILINILSFALIPVLAMIGGSVIAAFRSPDAKMRSILQHFAAGVVFSVVAVELLPDVMKEHNIYAVSIGFALGVAVMLGSKQLTGEGEEKSDKPDDTDKNENTDKHTEPVSTGMMVAIGVDILVDGFLLGIGFAAGTKEGKLLALALGIELLSLGLALTATLTEGGWSRSNIFLTAVGLASLIFVGSLIGATILQQVSAEMLEAVLAFGLAALLYLVTEELLTEAHEVPETPLITSSFFFGFLLFLILGMIS